MRALQGSGINFRELIKFKQVLFDSKEVTSDNKIVAETFLKLKATSQCKEIRNDFDGFQDGLLKEISKDGMVDMSLFCNIIDLVTFLPKTKLKYNPG